MPKDTDKNKNQNRKIRTKRVRYKLEGMPSSDLKKRCFKKRREQKRLKRAIFQVHDLIKFILILFLLWLASRIMICKYWYLPQNTFNSYPNEHIKIIGNRITPTWKILTALKKNNIPHKPMYLINTSPYEKEIEKLSPVKKAFVRRYWLPARFEVTVEEEIPVITIAPNPRVPEIAALTAEGRVISKDYLPINNKKYKAYKILTYDDYHTWTKQEIHSLQTLAQRIEDYSGENLIYLDVRNKKDVFARVDTIKIRIGELNTTLNERIKRLSSVMPQIESLKRQTDYIDLRWDNTTYLKKKSKNYVDMDYYIPPEEKEVSEKETNKPHEAKQTENKLIDTKIEQQKTNVIKPQTTKKNVVQQKPQNTAVTKPVVQKTSVQTTTKSSPKPVAKTTVKSTTKSANEKQQLNDIPKLNINIIEP